MIWFDLHRRFWHKVLYDIGVVSSKEPFQRLVSQGMILGEVKPSQQIEQNPGGLYGPHC